MQVTSQLSVFDYTDYRQFLADYYKENKKRDASFSYRYFAQRAGFRSSGFYKELIDGKRSLSRSLILKFAQAMKLTVREADYFENMVYFNEAKSVEERKLYFNKMMSAYESKAYKVHGDQYEYFSRWYYAVIRELIAIGYRADDDAQIANALDPVIRHDQAQKAVSILLKLGLIKRDDKGQYIPSDPVVTAQANSDDTNVRLVNLVNFQKEMIKRADEAFDRHHTSLLDMSTLTLSVSEETFKTIKSELTSFRKKILNLVSHDENPDRVYQLNQQLFPLSKNRKSVKRSKS